MLSKNEWPPLHRAAAAGQVDVVTLFLRCGADPDLKSSEGDTPLYLAIKNEQRAAAECLLAAGADPNARNSGRNTPLHLVATIPNPDLARLLLAHLGRLDRLERDRYVVERTIGFDLQVAELGASPERDMVTPHLESELDGEPEDNVGAPFEGGNGGSLFPSLDSVPSVPNGLGDAPSDGAPLGEE